LDQKTAPSDFVGLLKEGSLDKVRSFLDSDKGTALDFETLGIALYLIKYNGT